MERRLLKYIIKYLLNHFPHFSFISWRRMDRTNRPFDGLKTGCTDKFKVVLSGLGSSWWSVKSKNNPEAKAVNSAKLKRVAWHALWQAGPHSRPQIPSSRCCTWYTRSRRGHLSARWLSRKLRGTRVLWHGQELRSHSMQVEVEVTRLVPSSEAVILTSEFQKLKSTLPNNCNRKYFLLHTEVRSQILVRYVSLQIFTKY